MDKRRYQVNGTNYACMALDAKTVTGCVRNFLASRKKNLCGTLEEEMSALLRWATKAEVGASFVRDNYTVAVVDIDKFREQSRKTRI